MHCVSADTLHSSLATAAERVNCRPSRLSDKYPSRVHPQSYSILDQNRVASRPLPRHQVHTRCPLCPLCPLAGTSCPHTLHRAYTPPQSARGAHRTPGQAGALRGFAYQRPPHVCCDAAPPPYSPVCSCRCPDDTLRPVCPTRATCGLAAQPAPVQATRVCPSDTLRSAFVPSHHHAPPLVLFSCCNPVIRADLCIAPYPDAFCCGRCATASYVDVVC